MSKETNEELTSNTEQTVVNDTTSITASELADQKIAESKGNSDSTTRTEIPQHIMDMDWNSIRTYAKDLNVNIAGKNFDEVRKLVTTQESINLRLISGETDIIESMDEDLPELSLQEKMDRLIRVKVTNLNHNETHQTCMVLTIANSHYKPPSRVIKFGVITHVTAPMVEFLRNEKYAKGIPNRDPETGIVKGVRNVLVDHYNVIVLPPLSKDELTELAREQKETNRLEPLDTV